MKAEKVKRASYTLESKLEAVRLVQGGESCAAIAKVLGMPSQTLENWVGPLQFAQADRSWMAQALRVDHSLFYRWVFWQYRASIYARYCVKRLMLWLSNECSCPAGVTHEFPLISPESTFKLHRLVHKNISGNFASGGSVLHCWWHCACRKQRRIWLAKGLAGTSG